MYSTIKRFDLYLFQFKSAVNSKLYLLSVAAWSFWKLQGARNPICHLATHIFACFYHNDDVLNLYVVNCNDVKYLVPLEGSVNMCWIFAVFLSLQIFEAP